MLAPNKLVFTVGNGALPSVPILVQIDQEMRPRECPQSDTQIDRRTPIYNLSHAICYIIAMGQIMTSAEQLGIVLFSLSLLEHSELLINLTVDGTRKSVQTYRLSSNFKFRNYFPKQSKV